MQIDNSIMERVNVWLNGNYDIQTKEQINNLIENDKQELVESFYKTMEFGTGGLRGKMGVGSNRMNKYTVGCATQGLANYLLEVYGAGAEIKVAVACDSRNNSDVFSKTVAQIFAANSIKVYLFDSLRPVPELSFAIRHLGCQSGVVITASHNPKVYNGYKAYWNDGGQVTEPHDTNIIKAVNAITSVDEVKWSGNEEDITIISEDVDAAYLKEVKALSLSSDAIKEFGDIKIVYSPIHGSGYKLVPRALKESGFTNIFTVEEQMTPNGDFPTVESPNPEEAGALKMAIAKADEVGASLVFATDPDADRLGVAVRDNNGDMILLNGNQTAAILTNYILERKNALAQLTGSEFIVKTVVTTDLMTKIAASYNVACMNVLTGFKYIAKVIKENEGKLQYICGGEESYGFSVGDFVRDKDSISSSVMVCEVAAWAASQGKTLYQYMIDVYVKYGFFKEGLISITKEGKSGAEEIKEMMCSMRENPLTSICGEKVIKIADYKKREIYNVESGTTTPINYPVSDVLQYITESDTIVSMRPSGTEPKIKFYFGVREPLSSAEEFESVNVKALEKIDKIKAELKLV
ncbi:MAG: phospho-sugar mutase [Rikenellaceae bacterium]